MRSNIKLSRILPPLLIFVAVMVSVRAVVFEEGYVFKDDMAFPFEYGQIRESLINRFSVWYGKIGGGFQPTLPSSIPFWSLYNLLALLLRLDVLTKIVTIMPLIIAGCSMYIFSRKHVSIPASLLTAFLYMFNPWTFDRVLSGHLYLLMAYALTPIPLMFIFKFRKKIVVKDVLFAGMTLALILSFTMHAFVLICLLVMLYVIFMLASSRELLSKSWIGNLVLVFVLALMLNLFWLLPTFTNYSLIETAIIEPSVESQIIETVNYHAKILNTLRLTGYWLPYFRDSVSSLGFFSSVWSIFSFIIPILSFLAPFLRKDRATAFFSLAAVASFIPSIIASSSPQIYLKLIGYFSILALFRDSYKFIAIGCFSYSILIGYLFQTLLSVRSKLAESTVHVIGVTRFRRFAKISLTYFAIGLVLVSTLIYATPNLVSGDFVGRLSATTPPSYWFDVKDFLVQESDSNCRVLWTPPFSELHYEWRDANSVDPVDEYLAPLYTVSLKSFNPSLTNYLEFLTPCLYEEHYSKYLGKLLGPLSVKYVVVRLDALVQWAEDQYPPFRLREVFEHQQGLPKVFESGKWIVYENTYANPYVDTPPLNVMLVFGNSSAAKSLTYLFETGLPPIFYMDSKTLSQHDVDKVIELSNIVANETTLTLAIPIDQSVVANNLLKLVKGKTRLVYFMEGEALTTEESNTVPNHSFEEGSAHWNLGNEAFSLKISEDAINGQNSLEATTNCNASLSWSWISSDDIPVIPDLAYKFSTSLKFSNVMQSHIKIIGFNKADDRWEEICWLPGGLDGTMDWSHYEYLWECPPNFTKVKVILNAGWVKDQSAGNATTLFDDISITPFMSYDGSFSNARALPLYGPARTEIRFSDASSYKIGLRAFSTEGDTVKVRFHNSDMERTVNVSVGSGSLNFFYSQRFDLEPNNYTMEILSEKPVVLDTLAIISVNKENETLQDFFISDEAPAKVIDFRRVNPTSYVVKVNATRPFLLSLAEPYDQSWIAHVDGQAIEPTPLYSVINSYWINQTGQLEITIEYEAQKWFYYGSAISAATLVACMTYILIGKTTWRQRLLRIKRLLRF